jgi:pimeloyl-ACP methyl ester carboxylesterase
MSSGDLSVLSSRGAGYLEVPSGRVHVRTARPSTPQDRADLERKPLLLLAHQSPLSSRRYRQALDRLAGFCLPVAIDTPGYGESDSPRGEWGVADYADVLWHVADALGRERAWLFGRATGAVFALHAAALQPARVAGLVLHGLPVYTEQEKADRLSTFAPPYGLDSDGAHLRWIWSRIRAEYPWAGPELLTELARDYLSAGPDFASSYRAIWRHDLTASLSGLRPVDLLLSGTKDRIGYMHERAVRSVKHREALVLTGATDFVAEQDPQAFVSALRRGIEAGD